LVLAIWDQRQRSLLVFLTDCRQRYWQLLPINPVEASQGYSPYSATSAFAGNVLLISPELLVDDGLLQTADLTDIPSDAIVKYAEAETLKKELLQKAWQKFNESAAPTQQFEDFCEAEKTLLEDYSLYQVLKEKNWW